VPPPDPPPAAADSDSPDGSPRASPPLSAEQRQRQLQLLREQIAALAADAGHTGGSAVPLGSRAGSPIPPPAPPIGRPQAAASPPHDYQDARPHNAPHRARTHDEDAPPARPFEDEGDSEDDDGEAEQPPRVHSSISPASLADLLRGSERDLPLQHSPRNPFPRAPSLQTRAGHYDPAAAGDSVHAKVHSALQRIHKDTALDLVKTELCTLEPSPGELIAIRLRRVPRRGRASGRLRRLAPWERCGTPTAGSPATTSSCTGTQCRAHWRTTRGDEEQAPPRSDRQHTVRPRGRHGRSHLPR